MSNPEWTEPEDFGRPGKITRNGIDFYWSGNLGKYVTIGEDERRPAFTPVEAPSYPVSIFMAGDLSDAERVCREYCDEAGYCVTVTPTNYIYTGGEEDGFIVGLINYPRFPRSGEVIWRRAEELAAMLCDNLSQQSYTIQAPDKTVWFSHRPEDAQGPSDVT